MKIGYPGGLHNHSEYSNLRLRDSINRTSEMMNYAIELGHEVIAITEHECVCNAIKVEEYYNKIKKEHPSAVESMFYSSHSYGIYYPFI